MQHGKTNEQLNRFKNYFFLYSFYTSIAFQHAEGQNPVTMFAVGNANEPIGDSPYAVKCSAP